MTAQCGHAVDALPGHGAVWRDEPCPDCSERRDRERASRERARAAASRRAHAAIPHQFHDTRLADLAGWPGDLILACHTWLQQGGGLYVYGPVGTGKSSAAAAAAWELSERRPVRWVTSSRLARWAASDFGSDERERAQSLASSRSALVLDDFGDEPTSDAAAAIIKDVLSERLDAGSPLIVTSNLRIDEACARNPSLGQRVASRLRGYCFVVEVGGRDHRLDRRF